MSRYQHISAFPRSEALILTVTAPELREQETAREVKRELVEAVTAVDAAEVILDLQHVSSIGSVGLLSFLSLRRLPTLQRIVLCNLSPAVKDVFLLSRLLSEHPNPSLPFEHAESVEEAIALLQHGPRAAAVHPN